MSAALSLSGPSLTSAHLRFEAALPAIDRALRHLFRRLPPGRRDEAVADARAAAWHAWHGLLRRGQDPAAVGVTGIAHNAARYVKAGRRLGTGTRGGGAMDVFHRGAQRLGGFKLVRIDRDADLEAGTGSDALREWLACDNRVGPGDEAAFRVDFEAWLSGLTRRKRQMAELLAEGHGTSAVASLLGVTMPAVSIARTWLEASWRAFQGETVGVDVPAVKRPVGRPRKVGRDVHGKERGRGVVRAVVEAP